MIFSIYNPKNNIMLNNQLESLLYFTRQKRKTLKDEAVTILF
jgi:hypothetical protein